MPYSRFKTFFDRYALFFVVLIFFLISGACGLLYQVVWTRKLVLLFGTASYAVSTVLSIFFLGLGVGGLWGGRLADRSSNPLFVYGIFEVIIGLWAILFIFTVDATESQVVLVLRLFTDSRAASVVARATLALVFLAVPVILMGATLPLLARFVTTRPSVHGRPIGGLYSINTVGAVVGCAVTGFVLLAKYGYTQTTLIGAAANVSIGILALLLARKWTVASTAEGVGDEESVSMPDLPANTVMMTLLAFAASGFCLLGLEVLWTRLLILVFKGTTYAFTTMLTSLLCGIALGSAVSSLIVDKVRHRVIVLSGIFLLLGLSCIGSIHLFATLPDGYQAGLLEAGYQWDRLVWVNFRTALMVLFPPTFLSGMAFPFIVKIVASDRERLGRSIGALYSANTFGGVLGALAGGYLIIPFMGTHYGIVLLGCILFAMGGLLLLVAPLQGTVRKALMGGAASMALVVLVSTLPSDVGFALNRTYLPEDEVVLHYREGVEGTVLVSQPLGAAEGQDHFLWINAMQATAAIDKGVKMNRFQALLPQLFDREPKDVLFMCFGSGITAGTLGQFDYDKITAVELSADVLEAAPFFAHENFNVMENDRVAFVVDDGRNFLLRSREEYDLITFEPMPLAQAGVSTFYTREYYEHCFAHLAPRGMVSQWVPLHSLDALVVRSLLKTFVEVFPYCTAWFINADIFLIGSNAPLTIDYAAGERRIAASGLGEGLEEVYLGDFKEVLAAFYMGRDNLIAYAGDAPLLTDDRPWAEFLAPKLMYESHVAEALKEALPYRESPLPYCDFSGLPIERQEETRRALERRARAHLNDHKGLIPYYAGLIAGAPQKNFIESLRIDPDDLNAQYYLLTLCEAMTDKYLGWNQAEDAIAMLDEAIAVGPALAELHRLRGKALERAGRRDEAVEAFQEHRRLSGT